MTSEGRVLAWNGPLAFTPPHSSSAARCKSRHRSRQHAPVAMPSVPQRRAHATRKRFRLRRSAATESKSHGQRPQPRGGSLRLRCQRVRQHAETGLLGVAAPGVESARGAQKSQWAGGYRGSVSVSAAFFKGRAAIHPFGCPPMHIPAGGVLLQERPASAGTRRATFFSSTSASIFTMTSERLSPPPRARERAFSIRNSVASRGDSESTTEASSVGEK